MDGVRRRIVVGKLPTHSKLRTSHTTETVVARSCREVWQLLWMVSYVELVIADASLRLPDGTLRDLIRMVASEQLSGELHIIARDGKRRFHCGLGSTDLSENLTPTPDPNDTLLNPRCTSVGEPAVRMSFDVVSAVGAAFARKLETYREHLERHWSCHTDNGGCEVVVQEGSDHSYDVIVVRSCYVPPPDGSWFLIRRNGEYRYVGSFRTPSAHGLASAILRVVAA